MKKIFTNSILAVGLSSTILLAGCGTSEEEPAPATEQGYVATPEVRNEISSFLNTFMTENINNASAARENIEKVQAAIVEKIGNERFVQARDNEDVYQLFDDLDPAQLRELADQIEGLNPLASYYTYQNMDDMSRVFINMMTIANTATFDTGSNSQTKVSITVNTDSIEILEDDQAEIKYSDIYFKINDQAGTQISEDSYGKLYLVKVGTNWLIDGEKEYEANREAFLEEPDQTEVTEENAPTEGESTTEPTPASDGS